MTVGIDREAALAYVLSRRTPTGGFSFYREPSLGVEEPNAPDTMAALRSLQLLGTSPPDSEQSVKYLRDLQDRDGSYPTLTIGWAAIVGLQVLAARPTRSPARWLRHQVDGLFEERQVRDWSGAVTALACVGDIVHGLEMTFDSQRTDYATLLELAREPQGGWVRNGEDLELTGVAVRLLQQLNLEPGTEAFSGVVQMFTSCEDRNLGLCVGPRSKAVSVGDLWGGLEIGRDLGLRIAYPQSVSWSLMLLQRRDGGLSRRHRALSTLRDTWRGLEAIQLLDQIQSNIGTRGA